METRTYTRDGEIIESRIEFGYAARGNRSQHSGQKIHKLRCEYIVGLEEGTEVRPRTFAAKFQQTGQPVLIACRPICGCCQGQFAGRPYQKLTRENVTCSKC